jgi:hypothetical protein
VEISQYSFGKIEIDGQTYTADVIITPERVLGTWWRKQGHRLAVADLGEIMAAKPDILVVGTGYYGRMAIPEETRRYLCSKELPFARGPDDGGRGGVQSFAARVRPRCRGAASDVQICGPRATTTSA